MMKKIHQSMLLKVSLLFYLSSLFFPVYTAIYGFSENEGIAFIIFGIVTLFDDPIGVIWLANPMIWYGWYHINNIDKVLWASGISTLIALLFLKFNYIPNYGWCGSFLEPSPCIDSKIDTVELGYVFWLLSPLTLFVGNLTKHFKINLKT